MKGLESWVKIATEALALHFVFAMIIHYILSLDLVSGGGCQSISLGDLLIGLLYVETRL